MIDLVLTVLGFIAVLSILAIWAAWNEAVFVGVLAAFGLAIGSIAAIAYLWRKRTTR